MAIVIAFIVYLGLMMLIGIYYYRRTRSMADYILGNRKLGAWVTSLSAEASDMSGWMLMGLPGFAYIAGLCELEVRCRTSSKIYGACQQFADAARFSAESL